MSKEELTARLWHNEEKLELNVELEILAIKAGDKPEFERLKEQTESMLTETDYILAQLRVLEAEKN